MHYVTRLATVLMLYATATIAQFTLCTREWDNVYTRRLAVDKDTSQSCFYTDAVCVNKNMLACQVAAIYVQTDVDYKFLVDDCSNSSCILFVDQSVSTSTTNAVTAPPDEATAIAAPALILLGSVVLATCIMAIRSSKTTSTPNK